MTESFPFGEDTLVFKVMGKMFALSGINPFKSINLKCEPNLALDLREQYYAVEAGYHMNKKHWNTVTIHSDATDDLVYQWIDQSYDLIVSALSKKLKEELAAL